MVLKVKASYIAAYHLATRYGQINFFEAPDKEWVAEACKNVMIEEKGYPSDLEVLIDHCDCDGPTDLALVLYKNNKWELV